MRRHPITRLIVQLVVAVGIFLSLLFAGAAPSDFTIDAVPTATPR